MKTEKQKMLAGELYQATDPELAAERQRARTLCRRLTESIGLGDEVRRSILSDLLGRDADAWIEPPFYCDYGANLHLGQRVFFNFNCVVLDVMPVTIGDRTLIGPAVQIYTALHPLDARERSTGLEYAKAVTIGADVWIGGGAIICPGVTIGDRTVIGAGAVVTADLPSDVVAVGNPARVVRSLQAGQSAGT